MDQSKTVATHVRPDPAADTDPPVEGRARSGQPGWFLFGVLVGAVAMAGAMTLLTANRGPAVDLAAVRQAAREGAAEAISAAQPIGPVAPAAAAAAQAPAQAQAPAAAAIADSIAVRAANVLGKVDAPITLVLFVIVYGFVFSAGIRYINRLIVRGPAPAVTAAEGGVPSSPLSASVQGIREAIGEDPRS